MLRSGCELACTGCWVPALHATEAGTLVSVDRLAEALLDPAYERDGVSILGGEPFAQPAGLLALARALRARGCRHILCYSGYTYGALRRRSVRQPAIAQVLDAVDVLIDGPYVDYDVHALKQLASRAVDVLIDGPYVAALADRAGPWTGSGNQRVIDLVATRRAGQVVLPDKRSPRPRA